MPVILTDVADFIATVTLNRPARRNALSAELITDLRRVLTDLDARPDVRVIVLTGADPAFCAGLDLTELGQPDSPLGRVARGPVIPDLASPLIGAINGVAVTGGLELALACDFLVASERAGFADTHARVGIQPGWGLTVALPEAVGLRRAREMSATGNFYRRAHRAGLGPGQSRRGARPAAAVRAPARRRRRFGRSGRPARDLRHLPRGIEGNAAGRAAARGGGQRPLACARHRLRPGGPPPRGRHRTRPRAALTRLSRCP
jgi:Enoyl-CoA hydratase/isomerase